MGTVALACVKSALKDRRLSGKMGVELAEKLDRFIGKLQLVTAIRKVSTAKLFKSCRSVDGH